MSFYFPPEVEIKIFQLVFETRPYVPTDIHLATVCKYAQARSIEPILYKTLQFGFMGRHSAPEQEEKFTFTLTSKPRSFFKQHVKNIFFILNVSDEFIMDVLSACSGVRHLGVWGLTLGGLDMLELIHSLPLRSLDVGIDTLALINQLLLEMTTITYITLSLEQIEQLFDEEDIALDTVLNSFPCLTHVVLTVDVCSNLVTWVLRGIIGIVTKSLQSLMILLEGTPGMRRTPAARIESYKAKWKGLDSRIEVMNKPQLGPVELWEERIMNSEGNDFSWLKI
ncbi:hypothetical protein BDQ17DRAFT_1422331 [Cyathus striatus]|nr:hypothetical protein BDQ17DRAFT_1422331 [Cyathus striatus]